ncbi:MAG TPA: hypothetical protein EYN06_05535 [Myxococcales bacterium]|nr:hypothetical protein [Myxococcales bacterium]
MRVLRIISTSLAVVFLMADYAWSQTSSMTTEVIPPGQEALIKKMLVLPDTLTARTGCEVQDIKVSRTKVTTQIQCKKAALSNSWVVTLSHVSSKPVTKARQAQTKFFTLTAGAEHVDEVFETMLAQTKKHEAEFRWVAASQGKVDHPSDLPSPTKVQRDDADPVYQRYSVGFEMFRKKEHVKAFEHFLKMARDNPKYSGVLGMLVANLAPQQPDAARVKQFVDAAEKTPDSPLNNFLAGVSAHYSAHYKAATKDAKKTLYESAIKYLERTRPKYDHEPRVFIYLSVSHFRLGHQKQAEALIEKAVALNRKDPDAFYCRAEVFHRTQPDRAIKDIDRYLELTKAEGGVAKGKIERVRKMRAYLVRVQGGEAQLTELWDPITGNTYEKPEQAEVLTDSKQGLTLLIGMALGIFLLSLLVYRIRKKKSATSSS